MKSLWQDDVRSSVLSRVDKVDADAQRQWGTMTPERMLAHLTESMKMCVGEMTPRPKRVPLRFFPLKQLAIYLMPFPKGLPTAPELVAFSPEAAIEESKDELRRLFTLFAGRRGEKSWPNHPAFGTMSAGAWGVLAYRHFDHHLRQFGV